MNCSEIVDAAVEVAKEEMRVTTLAAVCAGGSPAAGKFPGRS